MLRDGVVTTAYHGVADVGTGAAVTAETRFAVGSLGKPMAATVALRLADAGLYTVDDPVASLVPELRGVAWAGRASALDLIANRSRLPLRVASEFVGWPDDDEAVLSRVAATTAEGDPTPPHWSYTNAGWCLLGRAMEAVTGHVWEDVVRSTLLEPSGLVETVFTTRSPDVPRASGHEIAAGGPEPVAPWTPRNLGPAGSTVLSTATDLLRFAARQVDDPALARLRTTSAEVRIHGWLDAWGLGWARFDWAGGPVWGWDGLMAGQRSVLRMVPHRRGAVVLLTNSGTGRALYRSMFPDLMRACFDVDMPSPRLEPSPGAAGDLSRFAGVYAWPDRSYTVTATGAGLVIAGPRATVEAAPLDGQTFLVDADDPDTPTVTFGAFDGDGRPGALYQMLWAHPRASHPDRAPALLRALLLSFGEEPDHLRDPLRTLFRPPLGGLDPAHVRLAVELRERVEELTRRRVGVERGGHVRREVVALRPLRCEGDRDGPADRDAAVAQPRRTERQPVAVALRIDAATDAHAVDGAADEVPGLRSPDVVRVERNRDDDAAARRRHHRRREPLGVRHQCSPLESTLFGSVGWSVG